MPSRPGAHRTSTRGAAVAGSTGVCSPDSRCDVRMGDPRSRRSGARSNAAAGVDPFPAGPVRVAALSLLSGQVSVSAGQLPQGHRCRVRRTRLKGSAPAHRAGEPGSGKHLASAPSLRSSGYRARLRKPGRCGVRLTRSASTPGTPHGFKVEGNRSVPTPHRARCGSS